MPSYKLTVGLGAHIFPWEFVAYWCADGARYYHAIHLEGHGELPHLHDGRVYGFGYDRRSIPVP